MELLYNRHRKYTELWQLNATSSFLERPNVREGVYRSQPHLLAARKQGISRVLTEMAAN